ncbi:hypothetical protein [Sorangium sp. So ce176]|uniref:hypothetical protein n=1 Tax=Sorangium sp. So ce176 TaxID=3133286 RepID=UPI003F634E10
MLSNVSRFLMVSAAASLVAFGSARAEADEVCGEEDPAFDVPSAIHAGALTAVANPPVVGTGAALFSLIQANEFWEHGDPMLEEEFDEDDLFNLWGSQSPSSEQYYAKLVAQQSKAGLDIAVISNVTSIAAGDVLVLNKTMTYSGHTAIVNGAAVELTTQLNPKFLSTRQWALPIIDSTSSKHGCNTTYPDSRWTGGSSCSAGTFTTGPGTAYMRLYSDLSGNLLGHTWSVTSSSTGYYSQTERPYVVARLTSTQCALDHADHGEP